MVEGHCLCGSVRFQIDEERILLFNRCYCSRCRRQTGTAFTSQLQLPAAAFRWLKGEDVIQRFESSPGISRSFCGRCGSRVPITTSSGQLVAVPAGLLDDDPGLNPEISMHTASKAPWDELDETIPAIPDQGSDDFWREFMRRQQS